MNKAEMTNLTERQQQFVELMLSGNYTNMQQIADEMECTATNVYGIRQAVLAKYPNLQKDLSFPSTTKKTKKRKNKKPTEVRYSPRQQHFLNLRFSGKYSSIAEIAAVMETNARSLRHDVVKAIVRKGEYKREQLLYHPTMGVKKGEPAKKSNAKQMANPLVTKLRQLLQMCCKPAYKQQKNAEQEIPAEVTQIPTGITGDTLEERQAATQRMLSQLSTEREKHTTALTQLGNSAHEYEAELNDAIATISSIATLIRADIDDAENHTAAIQNIDDAYLTLSEQLEGITQQIEDAQAYKIRFVKDCKPTAAAYYVASLLASQSGVQNLLGWMMYSAPDEFKQMCNNVDLKTLKEVAETLDAISKLAVDMKKHNFKVYYPKESNVTRILKAYFSLSADKRPAEEVQYTATVEISN